MRIIALAEEPNANEMPAKSEAGANELREMIDSCCETDRDRELIALRAESLTDAEAAKRLGISRPQVTKDRQRIEAAYDAKSLALGV